MWYHRVGAPVYDIGGALVDFLLHHFGTERFLKLYFACRPGTCDIEFRRIIGEDHAFVEPRFCADDRRVTDEKSTGIALTPR
jgi:hypothetical protein